ncbi:conserved Plasmodium protein, unknown function [Plasmodium chabaudi chabaudi]|uniref:CCAT-binding transcription factor-like protein n=1 Tax=Plasmodium chabaudi chabaudi TaxID=31271 RepID=A0A4V0K3Q6_PLACU|nr:conserved Plasmodium protein, unknown function [Plasmodium chabaudi chabaudi]VTZ67530.1 conserved Plasmodium protein, unknown function [Plasmodium chabaudi chabaudi]|eukprot:XP_741558.2 CCAT-binding transcription factor-like protein, putative [Plasmodium chabaudi chabaudi]
MKSNIIKISFALLFLSYYVSEINGNVTKKSKFSLRSFFTKNEDLNNDSDDGNVHGEAEEKVGADTAQTTLNGGAGTQKTGSQSQDGEVQSPGITVTQNVNPDQPCTEDCEDHCDEECDEECDECHDELCDECHDESCTDCQDECTDDCREECEQMRAGDGHCGGENIPSCTNCTVNDPSCKECQKIFNAHHPETHNARNGRHHTPRVQNVIEAITDGTKNMADEDEAVCDEQLDEGGDNEEEEEEDTVDIEDVEIIESTEEIEDSNDNEELELEEVIDTNKGGQEENEAETEATVTNEHGNNNNTTNTNEAANNNQTNNANNANNNQTNNTNNANNNQTNNTNNANNNKTGMNLLIKEYKGNTGATTEKENILDNALRGIDDNQFSSDIQDFSQDITEYALMEDDI